MLFTLQWKLLLLGHGCAGVSLSEDEWLALCDVNVNAIDGALLVVVELPDFVPLLAL